MNRTQRIHELAQQLDVLRRVALCTHRSTSHAPDLPTPIQLGFLWTIQQSSCQLNQLATQFTMTASGATQVVNSLVNAGWVQRQPGTADRRTIYLALTEAGEQMLQQAKKHRLKQLEQTFSVLTDQELEQLYLIHQKLVTHLQPLWNKQP